MAQGTYRVYMSHIQKSLSFVWINSRSNPAFEVEYLDDRSVWYLVAWSNQGTMLMAPIQGPPRYRSYHTPAAYSWLSSSNESVVCAQS